MAQGDLWAFHISSPACVLELRRQAHMTSWVFHSTLARPSIWRHGAPPGRSKDAENLQSNPDPPTIEAAEAKDSPPQPFRKEVRMKGVVRKSYVLSQVGKVERVSAARGKLSAAARGKEARSARNMGRYVRRKRAIDVVGGRLDCTVCDRRFESAKYARAHYIDG